MLNLKNENPIYLEQGNKNNYSNNCSYIKIVLDVELPNDYNESKVDEAIANVISSKGGQILNSKEYKQYKNFIRIELEAKLPKDYDEYSIDDELAEAIYDLDGQLLDSKEYKEIIPTNL